MARRSGGPDSNLDVANEALQTIANEQRLKIITVLGDACGGGEYGTLRYSDVLERTGLVDSGKLNYHLKKLVSNGYVEKVDDGRGYQLTLRGLKAYQAVVGGFYADDMEVEPFEIGVDHGPCGNPLFAAYESQRMSIYCPDCEDVLHRYPLPPGPLGDVSEEELLEAFDARFSVDIRSMWRGYCPYCSGRVEMELSEDNYDHMDVHDWEAPAPLFWCRNCRWFTVFTIDRLVMFHPLVMAFLYEHGVDVWQSLDWGSNIVVDDTLLSRDPLEFELTFTLDGDVLELRLDDSLAVVDHAEYPVDD